MVYSSPEKNKSDITRRVQETRYRLEEVRQEWRQRQGLLESAKCRVHGEEKRADHLQIFCDEVRERVTSNTQRSDQEAGTRLQKVDKFEVDMSQLGESLRKNATISGPGGFGCREVELKQEIDSIENELLKVEEKLEMMGEGEEEAENVGQGWVEMETKLRNVKKSTKTDLEILKEKLSTVKEDLAYLRAERNQALMSKN